MMKQDVFELNALLQIDDIHVLLNNGMLISSLMLAFTITLFTGKVSYEEMLVADNRHARWMTQRSALGPSTN